MDKRCVFTAVKNFPRLHFSKDDYIMSSDAMTRACVAFAKLLFRRFKHLQHLLASDQIGEAKLVLQEMIENAEGDAEA